jgi:CRISPR-associated endonuclease Csy4
MKYFIELTLMTDPEISPYFILSKLYTQLHLVFVSHKDVQEQVPYGVSFPQYRAKQKSDKTFVSLGSKLRIFAKTEAELTQLNLTTWLNRLSDYVHISSIKAVPATVNQWVTVRRVHPPANADALARRYAKRSAVGKHGAFAVASVDEARQRLQHYPDTLHQLAFIPLKSLSTGDSFNLVLRQEVVDAAQDGLFSTYGLSRESTLPHW